MPGLAESVKKNMAVPWVSFRQGDTESGEGQGTWTVKLAVGAGLHNLAKVVTKDSRISTWAFSCEKDRSEANGAFDATLGKEGAKFDSDPDSNGSPTI